MRWPRTGHAADVSHLVTAVALVTALLFAACDDDKSVSVTGDGERTLHTCTAAHQPAPAGDAVFCANPASMERARVLRVVDGDTIHVELGGREEPVRFYGIDTTERGEPCFAEASKRTAQLVGSEVRLRADARERDRYGRLLRYVYTPSGLSVGAEMVAEGLAHAWRADGALRDALVALEDAARAANTGCLWE